jgi:conjugal transfer/type IV secretion protein DotA/TraY
MMKSKSWLSLLIVLSLTLFSSVAFAASANDPGFFTPSAGDKFYQFINKIFPDGGRGVGPLSSLFLVFNSGVLIFAGAYIFYITIKHVVATAHTGEFGGKFYSMWTPVRHVAATSLMIPLGKSGLAASQLLIVYLITAGSGMGDRLHETYIDHFAESSVLIAPMVDRGEALALGKKLLKMNVCMSSLQKHFDTPGIADFVGIGEVAQVGWTAFDTGTSESGLIEHRVLFGIKNSSQYAAACGSLSLTQNAQGIDSEFSTSAMNSVVVGSNQYDKLAQSMGIVKKEMWMSQVRAMDKMITDTQNIAMKFVVKPQPVLVDLNFAINHYDASMKQAVIAATEKANLSKGGIMEQFKKDGWPSLGAFYSVLSSISQGLSSIVSQLPEVQTGEPGPVIGEMVSNDLSSLEGNMRSEEVSSRSGLAIAKNEDESILKMMAHPVQALTDKIISNLSGGNFFAGDQRTDLVLSAQALGSKLIWQADFLVGIPTGILLVQGLKASAGGVVNTLMNAAPGPQAAIDKIGGPLSTNLTLITLPIVVGLYAAGLSLFFLPMAFSVAYYFVVMSFLISCFVALIGGPLHAMAHLFEGGDDLMGKSEGGWLKLFSVFLYPSLLVFSMASVFLILNFAGEFINSWFLPAIHFTTANYITGLPTLLGIVFLYLGVVLGTIKLCISFVSNGPSQILAFIGGSASETQQASAEGVAHTEHKNTAIVGGVIQAKSGVMNASRGAPRNRESGIQPPRTAPVAAAVATPVPAYKAPEKPQDKSDTQTSKPKTTKE